MLALIAILLVAGAVVGIAAFTILRGFVLSQLWAWFVVPALGAPSLSIGEAIGITLVVSFLTSSIVQNLVRINFRVAKDGAKVNTDKGESLQAMILGPLTALGIGFILHTVFGVG